MLMQNGPLVWLTALRGACLTAMVTAMADGTVSPAQQP